MITVRPRRLWTRDPTHGDPVREVAPSFAGRTCSRPRENAYLAVVAWKEIIAASTEVRNSAWPMSAASWPRWLAARVKMTSGPCCCDTVTIWSGPTATVIAHADAPYNTAMTTMETNVAVRTVRPGL